MNYLAAFLLCIATTLMTCLSRDTVSFEVLICMDLNVACFLGVAWILDKRRG